LSEDAACYACGQPGHFKSQCSSPPAHTRSAGAPVQTDSRPPWCGQCDERTRQAALNAELTLMQRCPRCHPLAAAAPQHRVCPSCREITYAWEADLPCGKHRDAREWQRAYHAGEVPVRVPESRDMPLISESSELKGMNVRQLADELRALREMDLRERPAPSPERDMALRQLAARQAAESRASRTP